MNIGSLSKTNSDFLSLNIKSLVLYDTTLRDGAQTPNVTFSLEDKLAITQKLDDFGMHYIEGGWPASSPRDKAYFQVIKDLDLESKIAAFGMTSFSPAIDKNIEELIKTQANVITVFGKSWDLHVKDILKTSLEQNLSIIVDTIDYLKSHGFTVFFDAEHFFDGYKANPGYALKTLKAAESAEQIILCDTNGGSLPWEIYEITKVVAKTLKKPLGIHAHNDNGLALANTLAAVSAGVKQVQGTINGLGERCGNLDFCEFIPLAQLKLGIKIIDEKKLSMLKSLSQYVERLIGFRIAENKPFVGSNAFKHKAGVHVDAMLKNLKAYEHIDPIRIGAERAFILSEQAGRANVLLVAKQHGYELNKSDPIVTEVLKKIKSRQSFSDAELFLLLSKRIDKRKDPFKLLNYKTVVGKEGIAETSVELKIGNEILHERSKGVGPVHSLDLALRKALKKFFTIDKVKLTNYRVRILDETKATAASVEVFIEFKANSEKWSTVGVSDDIIKASEEALINGYKYYLMKRGI